MMIELQNLSVGSLKHRKRVARIMKRPVTVKTIDRPMVNTGKKLRAWESGGKGKNSGAGYWKNVMVFDRWQAKRQAVIETLEKQEWMTVDQIRHESKLCDDNVRKVLKELWMEKIAIKSKNARSGYIQRWSLVGGENIESRPAVGAIPSGRAMHPVWTNVDVQAGRARGEIIKEEE